jgi:plastocyanin
MKKFYVFFFALLISASLTAATYNVNVVGFTYSPAITNASVNDTIIFTASGLHPLVEVSQATWAANGSTPLPTGFGVQTSNFTYVVTAPGTVYFVCQNHVGSGMKGQIVVTVSNVAEVIGDNNISLLSSSLNINQATVLNATGVRGEMEIYDLNGKKLEKIEISADTRQQVSIDLKNGIYLYRFIMEGLVPAPTQRLYIGAGKN